MRTDRELIQAVINDKGIAEKFKTEERKKLETCNRCPDKNNCWSCGCHEWWIN